MPVELAPRLRPRARQPDRRAHRLQRRPGAPVRDRQRDHGHGPGRDDRRERSPPGHTSRRSPATSASATSSWSGTPPTAAAGGRSCVARRASCSVRAGRCRRRWCGSGATSRPGPACPPRRRWRWRCAWRCSSSPREPRPQRPDAIALARLCARVENDWVGAQTGLLDQLASLCGERERAVLIDFRGPAVRPVPLRARRLAARGPRLRRASRHRELGLQRPPRRMCARTRAARRGPPQRSRPRGAPGAPACAAQAGRPRARRGRPRAGRGRRAARRASSSRWGRCSTPPTRACAICTRSPPRPSTRRSRCCEGTGRAERG